MAANRKLKKGVKYVPLFDHGQQLLPGRHVCTCQARRHILINNCTNCGRIVCEQEGSGPCLFCHYLVMSKQEEQVLQKGGKAAEQLRAKLMIDSDPTKILAYFSLPGIDSPLTDSELLKKAERDKNRLLEFDRTSAKRTTVIDDQADYFSMHSKWLSPEQKQKLQDRYTAFLNSKHSPRSQQKYIIDVMGRKVIEERTDINMYNANDEILKSIEEEFQSKLHSSIYRAENNFIDRNDNASDSDVRLNNRPIYVGIENQGNFESIKNDVAPSFELKMSTMRLQDRTLQEMSDDGSCMSLHQPFASLLVSGIKKHEGRTWYTPHRGRLWIAAAARQPLETDIKEMENFYRVLLGDQSINFPDSYPIGCIVGCVDVLDCLPQEQYKELYPEGEVSSPYTLICDNSKELAVKFPIQGRHKIYKLDTNIHNAVKRTIFF